MSANDWKRRAGWAVTGLVILFLMTDAIAKLLALPVVVESGATLGLPGAAMARTLGIILAICTLLYAFPRTAILGAILITGYLGGAIATHLRVGNPLFSHLLFGVYVGIFAWGGIYLRDPVLRGLVPVRKSRER